jgi:hypothetical protein
VFDDDADGLAAGVPATTELIGKAFLFPAVNDTRARRSADEAFVDLKISRADFPEKDRENSMRNGVRYPEVSM